MDLVLKDAEFFAYQKSNIDHVAEKAKTSVNSQNQFPAKSFECGLGSGTRSLRDPRSNYGSRNFSNYWDFRRVCCLFSHSYGCAAVGQAERCQLWAENKEKQLEPSIYAISKLDPSLPCGTRAYALASFAGEKSAHENSGFSHLDVSKCFPSFIACVWFLSACPRAARP